MTVRGFVSEKFVQPEFIILDLDGTVYAGDAEIPGASEFVRRCSRAGIRVSYATNRSNRLPSEIADQLRSYGIDCEVGDIVTTAVASADYIGSGSAYLIGEHGLTAAFEEKGITLTDNSPDYVVVSIDRSVTYEKIEKASFCIRNGAEYLATNSDAVLKLSDRLVPGTGAIVAAVSAAAGKEPLIIGKPERLLFDMSLSRVGVKAENAIVIGDSPYSDIAAANKAGLRSVLMLTGVPVELEKLREIGAPAPDWICADFGELSALFGF